MSEQNQKKPIQFYTVCFPEYDSWTIFHGRLYQVRRDFFESRMASQESVVDYSEGMPAKYSHSISRWGMRWKKKLNGQLREYSCFDPSGSAIVFQDSESRAYGKIVFGKDLNWVCSYYYCKTDDSQKVRFQLIANPDDNTISLVDYSDSQGPVTTRMLPRPFLPGTVEQSLINSKLGEPRICAATNQGDFCYYHEDLADRYDQWMAQYSNRKDSLNPTWETDRLLPGTLEPDWYQEQERPAAGSAPSDLPPLEELGSLRAQLFQADAQAGAPDMAAMPEPFSLETEDAEQDRWVEEMSRWNQQYASNPADLAPPPAQEPDGFSAAGSQEPETEDAALADLHFELESGSYAASRELVHVEVFPETAETTEPEPVAQDVQEIMGMIDQMETSHPEPEPVPAPAPQPESTKEPSIQEVHTRGIFAEGAMPTRYTVAGKKRNSSIVRATDLFRKPEESLTPLREPEEAPITPEITSAKRIVISAQETNSYFWKVVNGLRSGDGQTQETAMYQRPFLSRKRKDHETYYYKCGQIYAAGNDSELPSLQDVIKRYEGFEPGLLDGNEDPSASRTETVPQDDGLAYSAEDGTIFLGHWKNNIPTGDGSAFDRDGHLIYHGGWKEGKRHGQGTEFSAGGYIIFDGEWNDDKYYNGVYFQRLKFSGTPDA